MSPTRQMHLRIVVGVLLAAGGCGHQNSGSGFVRIAITGRSAAVYLPLYIAGPSGCFSQEGIQVRLDETAGAAKSMEALLGGSAEVAAADYWVLLNVASHGQPVREFMLLQKIPGFAAIVSPNASESVHRIEDLKGRTVGVVTLGGAYQRVLTNMLLLHGLKPEEVSVVGVGNGLSLASAMERGVVDVGLGAGLTIGYLERRHPGLTYLFDTRTAVATKTALGTEEVPFYILCARTDWLKTQPQTARRLATATRCAFTWIQNHTAQQIRKILPDSTQSPDAESDYEWITAAKRHDFG